MRPLTYLSMLFSVAVNAQQPAAFDEELANRLGADELGMKTYMMVILATGAETELSEAQKSDVFKGHFSNMTKLATENKLVIAGPFVKAEPKRGLFVFNTDDRAVAEQWVQSDPAVIAGLLDYEIYEIYSSAALMIVNDYHHKIASKRLN